MMNARIIVKKPTRAETDRMVVQPITEYGVSTFELTKEAKKTCLILEGEARITHSGGVATITAGDYVMLPNFMTSTWNVTSPIKMHVFMGAKR